MRVMTIVSIVALAAMLVFLPTATAQKLQIGKEPGREVKEVTPGEGWKTCVRCQNPEHIEDALKAAKVEGRPFNPRDFTGVWDSAPTNVPVHPGGILLDFKTLPPLTPYGKQLWDA